MKKEYRIKEAIFFRGFVIQEKTKNLFNKTIWRKVRFIPSIIDGVMCFSIFSTRHHAESFLNFEKSDFNSFFEYNYHELIKLNNNENNWHKGI